MAADEMQDDRTGDHIPSELVTTTKRGTKARVACTVCHKRKDKTDCVLHVSARGKHKRVRTERRVRDERPTAVATQSQEAVPTYAVIDDGSPKDTIALPLTPEVDTTVRHRYGHVTWAEHVARPVQHEAHLEPVYVEDFLRSWGFVANNSDQYVLDRGPHLWVPQKSRKALSNAEIALLEEKGALRLPVNGFCEALLDAYFTCVHPLLPVIEISSFWRQYELQQPRDVSTLLLYSMFLAASNYVPSEVYLAHGWSSAAVLKECFYERAKVLFDMGIEQDKIVLAQSAVLMSYWYGNSDNIAVCWHWIGIACSLCQEMGLHRNPAPSQVPESRRRLWKRVWWCCYHRDRWIALGLGRPMRINENDHDMESLSESDLEEDGFPCHELSSTAIRTIESYRSVAQLFPQAVSLSVCLGHIMACHYVADHNKVSMSQSAQCEEALSKWYMASETMLEINYVQLPHEQPHTTMLLKHTLHILYQIVNIALHRSRLSPRFEASEDETNAKAASNQCWNAASAATDSLRMLIDIDMVSNLSPEMSTALVIMTSVLFTQRSWIAGLREKVVKQKLDLCLLVLKELATKYFAAQSSLTYFETAFARVAVDPATQWKPPTPSPGSQDSHALSIPPLYATLDPATSLSGFLSPGRWLYDLSCAFPAEGPLSEQLTLL